VKVRDDEGVANRIGPEPCASNGEASVGECTGRPWSRERLSPGCRRRSVGGRQHVWARQRVPIWPGVVEGPGIRRRSLSQGTGRARVSTARSLAAGPRQEGEEP
jgi:hypothetical protein